MIITRNDRPVATTVDVRDHPDKFAFFTEIYFLGHDMDEGKQGDRIENAYAVIPAQYAGKIGVRSNAGAAIMELYYARGLHAKPHALIDVHESERIIKLYEVASALTDNVEYGAHHTIFPECTAAREGCQCQACVSRRDVKGIPVSECNLVHFKDITCSNCGATDG